MKGSAKEPVKKPKIAETIVVEGRYDKNTLSRVVDAHIIETRGFGVFSDRDLLELIKKLAASSGVIIMTDGDGAGFVIRNYIKGAMKGIRVINAYIPDIEGKEKRKAQSSREGKLGVEGMPGEIIIKSLRDAGATFIGEDKKRPSGGGGGRGGREISKTDMYLAGLSGGPDSNSRRKRLQKQLGLPERLSTNALLQVLNSLYTYDEFICYLNHQDKRLQ